MEILVILLFAVVLIVILSFRSRAVQKIDVLQQEIVRLRQEVKQALTILSAESPKSAPPKPSAPPPPPMQAPKETEPYTPPPPRPASPPPSQTPGSTATQPEYRPGKEITEPHVFTPLYPPTNSGSTASRSFFEKHPDLEKFIGENLVSKIGIGVLVLAIGFFVKYAIDNDWIGPVGRVGIGLLCGGILVGIAHYLRNSYKAFSSVLVGGGLAVFYFSIALAYHQYHLFSQTVSFIIMLVITAFAVILSLLYDRQELAVIALVGGFVTPFLVSNGSGNYKVLFSYLLILNTGLLVIAYRKSWRTLNTLAFVFTTILFATWLATLPPEQSTTATYQGAFIFATAFYILFFLINIAHNIRENKKFVAFDFGTLLANTCLYFAVGLYLFSAMGLAKYQGLFSACMAVFNLASSYFLFRTKKVDTNILYLLIGITLTFISLTAPIQLHGHYITLFWASEAVLLYWLGRKSGLKIIGAASLLVWVAMLVSLVMDWGATYFIRFDKRPLPVIFNKGLMTTLYAAACCYMIFFLRRKSDPASADTEGRPVTSNPGIDKITNQAMIIVASFLVFAGGALEITYQFDHFYPGTRLSTLYLVLYGYSWAYGIVTAGDKLRWFTSMIYGSALIFLSIILYLVMIQPTYEIQENLLQFGNQGHFLAHWASALLVALIIRQCISWWRKDKLEPMLPSQAFSWLICIVIVTFLSAEVELLVNHIFYDKTHPFDTIDRIYLKTGLPILWGLSSFAFMWLGMHNKFKPLRIISLVLFSITLLKLFLIDIRNIPVAGKIAAFFCLGVLLLVVSFMYQRLKKIIIEDEEKRSV
ncbi:MAG: hypothetical protein BGO55_14820 [Sphingobacteriales bacterium 50-39]|nr:DUF2339 domain-containing protein [Sphingobacteriales bacterium]OJW57552.1 MAG: hypothetical protein BGO55_14820 [Sphingobacteriales bacterium 50-39]